MDMITAHGLRMPRLGLGTFRMTGARCQAAVESALSLGYRHIDTAQMYGNQDAVGAGWQASGVARADIHLTSKGHHTIQDPLRFVPPAPRACICCGPIIWTSTCCTGRGLAPIFPPRWRR